MTTRQEGPPNPEPADQEPAGPVPAEGSIVVCPDGPLLVRGDFEIITPSGEPVPRQRRTVALCRCGASAIKPYCDGTHKLIKFRTEPPGRAAAESATEDLSVPGTGDFHRGPAGR